MQKIIYNITVLFVILLGSCGDDFLDINHTDIVSPDVMMSSQEGIIQGLNGIYDLLYPEKGGDTNDIQQNWNFKPQMAFSNYPALDCQASGWDNEFTRHDWRADKDMFEVGWQQCYKAIDRANRFIMRMNEVDPDILSNGQETKDIILAEARTLRSFFYFYLAQNFGRVPMLQEGETFANTPNKARAETVDETWDFVINDLLFAVDILNWAPWNGNKGRVTKGMAKAYLAQAYMYKGDFTSAKEQLNDIISSEVYQLEESYGDIHMESHWWAKESVWEVAFPDWGSKGWNVTDNTDAASFIGFLTSDPNLGGWGALFISYEFVNSFEPGDRRLDYSVIQRGQTHPFTGETLSDEEYVTSERMPHNSCIKYWKSKPDGNNVYPPFSSIWMRYAAILLNYSECMFETVGETATDSRDKTGWDYINEIRDRAWGILEGSGISAPDAKIFYANDPHYSTYTAPTWKVALTAERRHEFLAEFSFWYDLVRTGMAEEHLNKEYPRNSGKWTNRQFDFQEYRQIYPIPYKEIITNSSIGSENQNPGY